MLPSPPFQSLHIFQQFQDPLRVVGEEEEEFDITKKFLGNREFSFPLFREKYE